MLKPLTRMLERAEEEKQDSDAAYFLSLMYLGETVTKLTVLGLLAASSEDSDRNRYRVEYALARANGIGDWVTALNEILTGPVAQTRHQGANPTAAALTKRSGPDSWQDKAVRSIQACFEPLNRSVNSVKSNTVKGTDWYTNFAKLRNDTRGHGAPSGAALGLACSALQDSIIVLIENLPLFALPWSYLRRSLSRKYRVTNWDKVDEAFESLKRTTDVSLEDGIHIAFGDPGGLLLVPLASSNPECTSLLLANGGFNDTSFEMLCYLTNTTTRPESKPYLTAPESLPPSETQGPPELYIKGNVFTNLPDHSTPYVARSEVEAALHRQLMDVDRHFIVSLTGRGGIGKTSVAIEVISRIVSLDDCPYKVVVWFSARDIDLTDRGPKRVRPAGVSIEDFADEYTRWIAQKNAYPKASERVEYFAQEVANARFGPTLFVFDNFETMSSQVEAFQWIDDRVKSPNKVLITSRENRFSGDWPVAVHGMTAAEAKELIKVTANRLGIVGIIDSDAIADQSDGHPYIIKLLLGEMSRGRTGKPERIIAGQDQALAALFERSYSRLSPAAQRVFLTLCSWRSSVPSHVLEPVLLVSLGRALEESVDVSGAIQECIQTSFIEESVDDQTGRAELNVPLSARLFGQRKLEVSEHRVAISEDSKLLQLLGPERLSSATDDWNRIRRFFTRLSEEIDRGRRELSEVEQTLELIAARFPYAWVLLADLYRELEDSPGSNEERALMRYVEGEGDTVLSKAAVWQRIADIREWASNIQGQLDALAQVCRQSDTRLDLLSATANNINSVLRYYHVGPEEKRLLLRDVVAPFSDFVNEMSATDYSRLGWLHMHFGDVAAAAKAAQAGLELDLNNDYCRNLAERARNN